MAASTIACLLSGLLTAWLILALRPIAFHYGIVDRPGGRKDHDRPTPSIGGLAIATAVIVTLFVVGSWSPAFIAFGAASVLLMVVGFLDDAYDLRWWWRIVFQVVAALIMIYGGGVQVDYIGPLFSSSPITLGGWAVPFTVFATVGLINAINMSDGADGLAGSLGLVTLLMLAAAAAYAGNTQLLSWLIPIVSAVAVFLLFNMRFPWQRRARVFLGNAGSAFLGLAIAWATFRLTQNAGHPVSPVLAPWFLAAPLIDCLVLIARRLKMGRSPFSGDRDHVHHLLLDAGFTPTQVALGLSAVSVLLGTIAALLLRTNSGNETHLVIGFGGLTFGYYWLTSRRCRAISSFTSLRRALRLPDALAMADEARTAETVAPCKDAPVSTAEFDLAQRAPWLGSPATPHSSEFAEVSISTRRGEGLRRRRAVRRPS